MLEKIGAGGMGEVYLAHDTRLDRPVALKVLTSSDAAGDLRLRLHREAQAAARLNHPGIAAIHDVLDEGDRCYIVMEYVEGRSLETVSDGGLSVEQAVHVAAQLADALAYAHDRGVVHRDVKPANVRLRPDGSAKLLDLGIARVTTEIDRDAKRAQTTGTLHGTPAYMAPELLSGAPADARTDIYSLGALLFELLAGRPPFPAADFLALAVAVTRGPTPSVRALNPSAPPDLDAIVTRALARAPADRFQSAASFAAALRESSSRLGNAPTRAGPPVRVGSRRPAAIGAALTLAVVLAAFRGVSLGDHPSGCTEAHGGRGPSRRE